MKPFQVAAGDAMRALQRGMAGAAKEAGIESEDEITALVSEYRREKSGQ